jgi:peptidoglycan-associated lipoprotein
MPPPLVEEARVAEQPIAPTPPSQPPVPQARPIPELADIFFDFDRFVIRDDARSGLEADAGLLKSLSGVKILIEGHCDERGTSAYNLVLGERRAQAATQYLRDLGTPSSQMQITSYGKERPFCAEHSEACWQSNRRAHFTR